MHYELEIAKHLNRGTKSVEGSQNEAFIFQFLYFSSLLFDA
jgi:hypothetical protein